MTKADVSGIAPFFIVKDVPAVLSFYRDRLGFDITFQGPDPDDVFFGIVQRGAAMIMLKWDAYLLTFPIRTRWPRSSHRAMSPSPSR